MTPIHAAGIAALAAMLASGPATAAILYADQMTDGTSWGVNASGTDWSATFNYDYSADGIPEAPNSQGGDAATRGLKLEANIVDPGAQEIVVAYPLGQSFSGTYQVRFDAWMNFDADAGFLGTTEFLGAGVGYDNVTSDLTSGVQKMATGDGGSGSDWRAFKDGFFVGAIDMAGNTRNGADPYYADFLPAVAPPAAQGQAGIGTAGSPGFQWITWQFTVINEPGVSQVLVDIEKPGGAQLRIIDIDCLRIDDGSSGCTSEGNISLLYADLFSSVSARPDLTFGLVDNVFVTDMVELEVAEPGTLALVAVGLVGLAGMRRRRPRHGIWEQPSA